MSLVSVIIPAYNCALFLEASLRSVQAQTYSNLDIVVIDDGSTDKTLTIAQAAAAQDARIRVFTQPNSGTPAAARNAGWRVATGEYIAFLDGDDLYHPEKIADEVRVLQAYPALDIVFCDVVQFQTDASNPANACYLRDRNFLDVAAAYLQTQSDDVYLCADNFYIFMSTQFTCLCTPSVLIRRRALLQEKECFPEHLTVGEDIDLWFRLARRVKIGFLNRALTYYRHHREGVTKNEERSLRGGIEAHRANLERGRDVFSPADAKKLRRMLARQHFSLAYLRFLAGHKREARALYQQARNYDAAVFSRIAWLKTFLPDFAIKRLWSAP